MRAASTSTARCACRHATACSASSPAMCRRGLLHEPAAAGYRQFASQMGVVRKPYRRGQPFAAQGVDGTLRRCAVRRCLVAPVEGGQNSRRRSMPAMSPDPRSSGSFVRRHAAPDLVRRISRAAGCRRRGAQWLRDPGAWARIAGSGLIGAHHEHPGQGSVPGRHRHGDDDRSARCPRPAFRRQHRSRSAADDRIAARAHRRDSTPRRRLGRCAELRSGARTDPAHMHAPAPSGRRHQAVLLAGARDTHGG